MVVDRSGAAGPATHDARWWIAMAPEEGSATHHDLWYLSGPRHLSGQANVRRDAAWGGAISLTG